MTKVKKTTPSTLVAFCSSRMIRPWRDEFRDITLELREWCDRTVPHRLNRHGVDLFVFVLLTDNIFETELSTLRVDDMPAVPPNPFKTFAWFRSVAERRSADVIVGTGFCMLTNVVWWLPKLEPRRDFWLFRVSHVTTVFDFVGGFNEKLSFRIGTGVGDVAGVGVVELLNWWWFCCWPGAVNRCSDGAELPICNAVWALGWDAPKFRRDTLFAAIAIGLLLISNGDNSSGFNSDTIRTRSLHLRCSFSLAEPKYGQVHGGGNLISVDFDGADSFVVGFVAASAASCCCCCFSCTHNWLFDFSVEFSRSFWHFTLSESSASVSSSSLLSFCSSSTSLSIGNCSSNPISSCSIRGKLLHRLRKFNSEPCDSLRLSPLVDHVECDARRVPLLRRAGVIGLCENENKKRKHNWN